MGYDDITEGEKTLAENLNIQWSYEGKTKVTNVTPKKKKRKKNKKTHR